MTEWPPEVAQKLQPITGETLRPGGLEITEQALRFCNFLKQSLILDAGCGIGATIRYLRDHYKMKAFGIDLSAPLLTEARLQQGELPLIRGKLESLPFGGETFDGVTCECVLSDTSISQVLEEFSRVLRTGGLLILSDLYRCNFQVNKPTSCKRGLGQTAVNCELKDLKNPQSEIRAKHPAGINPQLRGPGLLGKDQLIAALTNSHFETLLWEDRTTDLKILAARLIMKGVSFDEILSPTDQTPASPRGKERKGAWRELGYYLLIARKTISDRGV